MKTNIAVACPPPFFALLLRLATFVGDGVNCALRNALIPACLIKDLGVTELAVAEYGKRMFPYARDVINRSMAAQELLFEFDAPRSFLENMKTENPLAKFHLDY